MKIATIFVSLSLLGWFAAVTLSNDAMRRDTVIGGDCAIAKPMLDALVKAYREDRRLKEELQVQCQGEWEYAEAFGRGKSDGLLSVGPLPFAVPIIIAQQSPDGNFVRWDKIELGEIRVIVIVHASNKISGLTLEQIQKLLIRRENKAKGSFPQYSVADQGIPIHWTDLGGQGGLVTCYGEDGGSISRKILREQAMLYKNVETPGQSGVRSTGYYPFRDNFALCPDAEEVIEEIVRDRNGIGFIAFTGKLPEGVRIVPLAKTAKGPFIAPKLKPVAQADYPLRETITLHVHPSASATMRDFVKWTSGRASIDVLLKIPGYAKTATKEQENAKENTK